MPESQLTSAGAERPIPLTDAERSRVDEYTDARNGYLKQSRESQFAHLRGNEQADIETATSAIRDHMTPDDLAGAIKEDRGSVILRNGVAANHVNEIREARASVVTAIENIKTRIKAIDEMGYGSVAERDELEHALSSLSRILDDAEAAR